MMHESIKAWLEADEAATLAVEKAEALRYVALDTAEPVGKLRPATAADIRVGALIWYVDEEGPRHWQIVGDVLYPSDPWKAYCALDGCRYGLDGAMVESDSEIGQ